jgi:hypothetical protein
VTTEADADQLPVLLATLRDLCGRLARGDYGEIEELFALTASGGAPPIVQELAEAFGSMAVQIEAREFRLGEMLADLQEAHRQLEAAHRRTASENVSLRGEVERLTIAIDQVRKEREVQEIVETDYFQTLQQRARSMRERHRGEAETGE